MGLTDRVWDMITTAIKLTDKVDRVLGMTSTQQDKLEKLTERVIRLEMALVIALGHIAQRQVNGTFTGNTTNNSRVLPDRR